MTEQQQVILDFVNAVKWPLVIIILILVFKFSGKKK